MKWSPGQWILVRVPSLRKFASHPFTISTLPQSSEKHSTITLLARTQSPHGLVAELHQKNHRLQKIKVVIDGPYGGDWIAEKIGWKGYEKVLLIAGGSGASWSTAHFLGLLRHALDENSLVREINFVWVVRHASHLTWFRPQLDSALQVASPTLPPSLVVNLKFFVSSSFPSSTPLSSEQVDYHEEEEEEEHEDHHSGTGPDQINEKRKASTSGASSSLPFEIGRPDLSPFFTSMVQ